MHSVLMKLFHQAEPQEHSGFPCSAAWPQQEHQHYNEEQPPQADSSSRAAEMEHPHFHSPARPRDAADVETEEQPLKSQSQRLMGNSRDTDVGPEQSLHLAPQHSHPSTSTATQRAHAAWALPRNAAAFIKTLLAYFEEGSPPLLIPLYSSTTRKK